jgi:hypothetical protein
VAEYETAGEYSGGGESGTARTYTATSGGKTKTFTDFNEAAGWAAENREPGGTAEVTTK